MSLRKALSRLSGDRATETAVSEILRVMCDSTGTPVSAGEVAGRVKKPEAEVLRILSQLAEDFVVLFDGERYTYKPDSFLAIEVDRFVRRVETRRDDLQSNVAKFRGRFGPR